MLQHGTKPVYSLSALSRCFLKLGSNGFGGLVALVGYRHKNLVEENQWISEEEYKQGLKENYFVLVMFHFFFYQFYMYLKCFQFTFKIKILYRIYFRNSPIILFLLATDTDALYRFFG